MALGDAPDPGVHHQRLPARHVVEQGVKLGAVAHPLPHLGLERSPRGRHVRRKATSRVQAWTPALAWPPPRLLLCLVCSPCGQTCATWGGGSGTTVALGSPDAALAAAVCARAHAGPFCLPGVKPQCPAPTCPTEPTQLSHPGTPQHYILKIFLSQKIQVYSDSV